MEPKGLLQSQICVYRKANARSVDALEVFKAVQACHSETFFLETSSGIGQPANQSVIAIGPFEILRDRGTRAESTYLGTTRPLQRPFFEELRERVRALELTANPTEDSATQQAQKGIPYRNGGIFGCIGYDCISELEPRLQKTGYFRERSLETEARAEVAIAKRLIVISHADETIHLMDLSEAGLNELESMVAAPFRSRLKTLAPAGELNHHRLKPYLGAQGFTERVNEIKEHIRAGDIFQAVLAERFECETYSQPLDIFTALRRISPAPYSYFFDLGERVFFGASPEALVKVEDGRVETHPIAGTKPRGRTPGEDRLMARRLVNSRKEASEHLMLVDLARNDLGKISEPGTVEVKTFRSVQRLSNVMHLVSVVESSLAPQFTALDAFRACFPAGTLSGAPKIRAMEILSSLEQVPRGLYGGAVVAFDSGARLDSCIAIRSLEMRGRTAILRAGAGIVADSKPESEYAEVHHKLKLLRQAIACAEMNLIDEGAVS